LDIGVIQDQSALISKDSLDAHQWIDGVIEKNYRLNHIKVASLNMPDADGIYMVTITSGTDRAVFRIVKR
jgi:hypothetical protein